MILLVAIITSNNRSFCIATDVALLELYLVEFGLEFPDYSPWPSGVVKWYLGPQPGAGETHP